MGCTPRPANDTPSTTHVHGHQYKKNIYLLTVGYTQGEVTSHICGRNAIAILWGKLCKMFVILTSLS